MSTTGAINGTDAGLAVETTPGGGTYADIGGITTNSMTFNNGLIDITNKSSASWRELLPLEGLQSADITAELVFNSDANFDIMKASFLAKTALSYEYARGGETLSGPFMIASWAETSPDNDKLTVSVSLQSQDAITIA